jgi:hypothetical protein
MENFWYYASGLATGVAIVWAFVFTSRVVNEGRAAHGFPAYLCSTGIGEHSGRFG